MMQSFQIPVGEHALTIPGGEVKVPEFFWEGLTLAALADRHGFNTEVRSQMERLQGWLEQPDPQLAFPGEEVQVQLPARWMLMRVTSRLERWVVDALSERKIECYAPVHITEAKHAKRVAVRCRPLIPGYVFANLPDDDAIDTAREMRGVIEIMCRTDPETQTVKPMRVRTLDIGSMIFLEACHVFDETWQPPKKKGRRYSYRWAKDDAVRIQHGAFDGFAAQVLRGHGRDMMEVLITVFGRSQEVLVAHSQLVRLT